MPRNSVNERNDGAQNRMTSGSVKYCPGICQCVGDGNMEGPCRQQGVSPPVTTYALAVVNANKECSV